MWLKIGKLSKINHFPILPMRLKPNFPSPSAHPQHLWDTNFTKTSVPLAQISLNIEILEAFLLKSEISLAIMIAAIQHYNGSSRQYNKTWKIGNNY